MKEYLVCYDNKRQGGDFSDRLSLEETVVFIKINEKDWHGYYIVKIIEDKFI